MYIRMVPIIGKRVILSHPLQIIASALLVCIVSCALIGISLCHCCTLGLLYLCRQMMGPQRKVAEECAGAIFHLAKYSHPFRECGFV